jgi:hypothetical protein
LKLKRALVEFFGKTAEGKRFIQMLLDETADRFYAIGLGVPSERTRTAAQAGPVSRLFSRVRCPKELHILPPGPPCGARWPAVDAGRRNRKEELAIAL